LEELHPPWEEKRRKKKETKPGSFFDKSDLRRRGDREDRSQKGGKKKWTPIQNEESAGQKRGLLTTVI